MSSKGLLLSAMQVGKSFDTYDKPSHRLLHRFSTKYAPRRTQILRNVNLELHESEIVGIVGCNGAGKTTLLRVLSGIFLPSEGQLETSGRVCPVLDLGFGLVDDLSGHENIYFVGALRGFTRQEMKSRVSRIIEFADIGNAINDPIEHYSTGMKMRLAYAVSTHLDPKIMIIDEALAVGDEGFQHKCFEHLRKLADSGVGIIFVSHSSQTIRELCDRTVLLDEGEIIQSGEPSRVTESYHRLLFAPADHRQSVRDAIRENKPVNVQNLSTNDSNNKIATFDPALISEPVVYPDQGATIINLQILDNQDQQVNLLSARAHYAYQFDVTFSQSFENVELGMLIKSVTGFEIGGSETSHLKHNVARGERLRIRFPFTCSLNPGSYFMNAGVRAIVDGEETFIARIIDALQFKVLPNDYHQTGQVDFGIDPSITTMRSE
tara:strand:+ start:5684 stop:6988 length:1305 start_codon:yes stop_codon:yes gene_type:complete